MMNFFNSRTSEESRESGGLTVTQRANTYFDKMEARSREIMEEVKESGQLLADADTDPYKRSYLQFKAAILAQFTALIQKGSNTYQTQIMPKANGTEMIALSQRFTNWHTSVLNMMTNAFDGIQERNLEKEYKEIMEAYELAREKFHCKQCGASLSIKQFYFTATYIPCEFCQTQNTFDPGTRARMVEHMARPLAASRCKQEYEAYRQKRSAEGKAGAAPAYENYVKAVITEMDKILPGTEELNQNFYKRLIQDYNKFNH